MDLLFVFKQLLEKQRNQPSSNTVKSYLSDIRSFSTWFSNTYQKEISIYDFSQELLMDFVKLSPLSPNSKDRQSSAVKKMLQLFFENQIIDSNPFPKLVYQSIDTDIWKIREFKHALLKQKAAPLTVKNYLSDIQNFTKWIDAQNITLNNQNITEDIINSYKNFLVHVLSLSPKSVNRKLSTIRKYTEMYNPSARIDDPISMLPSISNPVQINTFEEQLKQREEVLDLSYLHAFKIDHKEYSSHPIVRFTQKIKDKYVKFEEHLAFKTAKIVPKNKILLSKESHVSFLNTVKNNRPAWYKTYHNHRLTTHIHVFILALFCSGLLLYGYAKYIDIPSKEDVLGISQQNNRVLVYSGNLKNADNKAITHSSQIRFSIYPDASANESTLWEEVHQIKPQEDGSFSVQLGRKNTLEDSFFTDNQNLYLGIQINNESELLPRQRLANVGYSSDTALLDGMAPITQNPANATNSILALNSSGNLVIGGTASPIFQASGGEITLSGVTTLLTTNSGSDGNIVINPDGSGVIDIRKPIVNDSQDASASGSVDFADEVSIATESAGSVLSINNTGDTGAILSLLSQNITRMLVDVSGKVGIGTSTPRELLHIANSINPTFLMENTLSGASFAMTMRESQAVLGSLTNNPLAFQTNNFVRMTIAANGNVGIGTSNPTALLDVGGNINVAGILTFSGSDQRIQSANNSNLIIGGNTTSNVILQPLIENGFVGISTTNPQYKLDVTDTQNQKAVMQLTNTSTSTQASGLNIQLGNNTSSNQFISFQTRTNGVVGSITGGGSGVQYHTTAADFAEYFKKDTQETISYGTIVCLNTSGLVTSCVEDNQNIVGVSSEKPGFVGGKNLGNASVIVGLVGQIETYVSGKNGPIQAGDPISVGGSEGIGIKATNGGRIVGRALQPYDSTTPGKILVYVQPTWHDPTLSLNSAGVIESTTVPEVELDTATYETVASAVGRSTVKVTHKNNVITTTQTLALATIGKLKSGLIETQSLLVSGTVVAKNAVFNQLSVTSDNFSVNGTSLREYITSVISENDTRESPETVKSNFISPLSKDSQIGIKMNDSNIEIIGSNNPNSSNSAVATIDNNGNASFNGNLQASSISSSGDASVAGTLTANSIKAKTIEGIEDTVSSIASRLFTAEESSYIDVSTMSAQFALFHENLLSLGTTTMREATVLDSFTIGTQFILGQDSMNVLGADLQIQPLRQGGVSFLGGMMSLDKDGNLFVGNDARFAKNVTIEGGLFANILSPLAGNSLDIYLPDENGSNSAELRVVNGSKTPVFGVNNRGDVYSSGSAQFVGDLVASGSAFLSKLNIFGQDAQAGADGELQASSSAGTALLKAYKSEVTIKSPHVTGKSLIYITPSTNTGNKVLYLLRQSNAGSFTVGISESAQTDVQFNWIIVN
jgi:site-specific recombinase XerD